MFSVECRLPGTIIRGEASEPCEICVASVDNNKESVYLQIGELRIRLDGPDTILAIQNALRNE